MPQSGHKYISEWSQLKHLTNIWPCSSQSPQHVYIHVTATLFKGDQSPFTVTFQVNATNRKYNQAALIFRTKGRLWHVFSGAAVESLFVCGDVQVKMGLERKARIQQNRFHSVQIPKILNWSKQRWALRSSVCVFLRSSYEQFLPTSFLHSGSCRATKNSSDT